MFQLLSLLLIISFISHVAFGASLLNKVVPKWFLIWSLANHTVLFCYCFMMFQIALSL